MFTLLPAPQRDPCGLKVSNDIRAECKAQRQVPSELHLTASQISRVWEKQMQRTKRKVIWQYAGTRWRDVIFYIFLKFVDVIPCPSDLFSWFLQWRGAPFSFRVFSTTAIALGPSATVKVSGPTSALAFLGANRFHLRKGSEEGSPNSSFHSCPSPLRSKRFCARFPQLFFTFVSPVPPNLFFHLLHFPLVLQKKFLRGFPQWIFSIYHL